MLLCLLIAELCAAWFRIGFVCVCVCVCVCVLVTVCVCVCVF